tara:strand:+ start:33 stop:605 length:573 start_codon:yes stop_codon:yes gene_type:complete
MERKNIQFGVEKVQHTWYFHFDASTGMVESMSVVKQSNSIEIPNSLAEAINTGSENMAFYKVIFENGKYTYTNTVKVTPTENTTNNSDVVNPSFYKLKENALESKIVFEHIDKQISISATETMKNTIKDSFKKDSTHRFYLCKKNDHSILHKMIEINLHDLVDQNITVPVDVEKEDCSIFCRKILEYSHV